MVVFRGLENYRELPRPVAVAIGNFDGLHLGHRKILRRLLDLAHSRNRSSLVLTFFPHPGNVLGSREIPLLQTLEQRLAGFEETGVEAVIVAAFDRAFADVSSKAFINAVLIERLNVRDAVVGHNFRFGKDRKGDTEKLRHEGNRTGLEIHVVAPEMQNGQIISSSLIRELLERGEVDEAARFLGRPYEIVGTVVPGSSRGRNLGFPTANVRSSNLILPDGVFITQVTLKGQRLPALTSIGTNPTFGPNPLRIETYILDFEENLYGESLSIRLLKKIRKTEAFEDAAALKAMMEKDLSIARSYFGEKS